MSENEYKSGFRVNIKALRGKDRTEALAYFRPILGEPVELDEYDGVVNYFYYDCAIGEYQPREEFEYRKRVLPADGKWFIDMVVAKETDYSRSDGHFLKIGDMQKIIAEIKEKFEVDDEDIVFYSYSWYNGTDEPVIWPE